jgi:ABC-type nitrate/sulfonate/bicarbonate transport system substrate-binding protein
MYTGLFIYHAVDVTHQLKLSDINVEPKLNNDELFQSLARGDIDMHAGLWAPLQKELYCPYIGKGISLEGDQGILIKNSSSPITISDLGKKNLTIYTERLDTLDTINLRRFISEAGLDESKITFRVGDEEE